VLEAHLAAQGETAAFCGSVVASGTHLRSLAMILDGTIDAAAIDSTVLEMEIARRPGLAGQIRSVASLGPTAHPPAVIRRDTPAAVVWQLRTTLLQMHNDGSTANIFAAGRFARFAAVRDHEYDLIRHKTRLAAQARLALASEQ
jgi:phosphonate transport system substrate-binding protein